MNLLKSKTAVAAVAATAFSVAVAGGATAGASVTHRHAARSASISLSQLTNNFSAMKQLKSIAAKGTGKIAAILPDTTTSTRWAAFDAPMLKQAMLTAGIPASDIIVQNAQGSDSRFYTDAQTDITNGAKVLFDDSGRLRHGRQG